ncbi:N-acyl-D-amino-acid deacylase family protein [Bowmanella dokdonensis]|uniref:Amidohydrolase family protein n=1 Tax=Bowmanella dokdonensis TaxID=751969 RepID=A0A939DR80_9ALTE|nr:amidohydrolase family protein [Bowmanella dokdonensis]MBN7827259.1 amidohydrolase family protein [Bowmanella dokdonensis]
MMKLSRLLGLSMAILLGTAQAEEALDLLITNAQVVDGSGRAVYAADVGIRDDRIAFIGQWDEGGSVPAKQRIDARGRILAPGFIDLHAHGDPQKDAAFTNFLAMGVTSILLGQDGFGPVEDDYRQWQQQWEEQGSGVNIGMLVGHGSLRRALDIGNQKDLSEQQMQQMSAQLKRSLGSSFGLSTGLEYVPALYAKPQELVDLAQVVGKADRLIMSHMRNEDDNALFAAIDELAAQGKHARVHVSHIKSVYGKGAARGEQIIARLTELKQQGIEISADFYPYNASYTGIAILFPDWAKTGGQLKQVLPERRQELLEHLNARVSARNGPEATLFGSGPYQGLNLAEAAEKAGKPFAELLLDDIGPQGASAAYFIMDKALQGTLLEGPMVAISSDGSPTMYHPRGYGAFAKLIEQYVVNEARLSLEQAVHKATGLAADILKLPDRGRIAEGMKADLILFYPEKVKANADYNQPHKLASGFDWVIVNGQIAWQQSQPAARAGTLLLPEEH